MRKVYKQTILKKEKEKDHKHVTAPISQTMKVERLKEESFSLHLLVEIPRLKRTNEERWERGSHMDFWHKKKLIPVSRQNIRQK